MTASAWVSLKAREVEFSSGEEEGGAHGFEERVSVCFVLGGLKEAVDSRDKPVTHYALIYTPPVLRRVFVCAN